MKVKFPKTMFIASHGEGDDSYWASKEDAFDAIEDDGPTVVAEYRLVGTQKLKKGVQEVK